MSKLDIIIPIFNEGKQIIKLLDQLNLKLQTEITIYLCYDNDDDNIFQNLDLLKNLKFEIKLIKNPNKGPCTAVIEGLKKSNANCKIVFPADDFINIDLIDKMYNKHLNDDADIVVASRFIEGGSMKGCPLLKSILVRLASGTLYFFSSIPVRDASNGFRLFSQKLLNNVKLESKLGFAYSLELLVKCNRLKFKIVELPAQWEERSEGESRFKIFKWLREYLRWYFYGLKTYWLKIDQPINLSKGE
jgi:dolichol-phosphate mannosyltransferase|tara:strand:+ start:2043 stop:2780 length:738 start_codon:yes stop_codon:yes gene_type:complete